MKKNRYIPYGYTIRNGKTVIEHSEADIIREIFDQYICGASLKEIAESLTLRKIPYTEKTDVWGKARIARIIENAKYIGDGDYDPIIDEDIYENAVRTKTARQTSQNIQESEGISVIRNRVKCANCGSPMVRHISNKMNIRESWTCQNPECGIRVRIPDGQLLEKLTIIINRIIKNSELMIPKPKERYKESPTVRTLQEDIDRELARLHPSEDFIMDRIGMMASTMYRESDAKASITARIAKRRVDMMKPGDGFNGEHFSDIVSYITLNQQKNVVIHTKTEIEIGEENDGSTENS